MLKLTISFRLDVAFVKSLQELADFNRGGGGSGYSSSRCDGWSFGVFFSSILSSTCGGGDGAVCGGVVSDLSDLLVVLREADEDFRDLAPHKPAITANIAAM